MGSSEKMEANEAYFTFMVDHIPVNYYFDNETKQVLRDDSDDEESKEDTAPQTNGRKKRGAPALSEKAKFKRAKFDPAQIKTVSQMSEDIAAKEAAAKEPSVSVPVNEGTESTKDDLRSKLQAKIQDMQIKRNALTNKEEFQKRRLKRTEKKAKKKMQKQKEKQAKPVNGAVTTKPKAETVQKKGFNKDGNMIYNTVDFGTGKKKKKQDLKSALAEIENTKKKVAELKEKDPEAANKLQEKQMWKNMILKADGVNVKDDEELIKKSLKKKEKKKEKSQKKWTERQDHVQDKMQKQQDKRKSNIKKKKDSNKKHKITKAKKKGRIIPGF